MLSSLEQVISTILFASEKLEEEMKQASNLKGLTSRQLYCLELIKRLKNPSITELAKNMDIAKASMSVMVDRLEKNGYVLKVSSDSDRRSAHIHLTESGEKAAALHIDLHKHISGLLTQDMTDSEKQILEVLLSKSIILLPSINK